MRVRPPLCPEGADAEDADERIRDPHGENLHWAKREETTRLNRMRRYPDELR